MKIFKIMAAALLIPAASFACGSDAPREGYQGDKKALSEIVGKPLSCTFQGKAVEAEVTERAIYRCIGSPVKVELEAFNQKFEVQNIYKDAFAYNIVVQETESAFRCELKN